MPVYRQEKELTFQSSPGHRGGKIIDESNGAVNGFIIGISYYDQFEYGEPGIHEDQEGFYIIEGTGTAKIGEEEFAIAPGTAFIAAKGVPHTVKRDSGSPPIKVCWSHGAV